MKTLLLCAYRTSQLPNEVLGLTRDARGMTLIDRRILALSELGMEVTCVLAGNVADEQLRHSPRIQETDMVFDDTPLPNLATNTATALENLKSPEACFILPVEVPLPPAWIWAFLRNEYGKEGFHTDADCLQAMTPQGAPWHLGFPLLFTRHGTEQMQISKNFTSLVDPRLKYLQLVYSPEAALAPEAKLL